VTTSAPTAPASSARPFRGRTLAILIAAGVGSLVVALVLAAFGDDFSTPSSAAPDGYSQSMNGHRALIEILGELDVPVVVSRHSSASKAARGVLVIAEPQLADEQAERKLRAMAEQAVHVLIVLPRYAGTPDPRRPGWIADRHELPVGTVEDVLDVLDIDESVDRVDAAGIEVADDKVPPPSAGELQVLSAGHVEPLVWVAGDRGAVLATTMLDADTRAWILADPGIIDNSGLRDRANVHFTVGLLELLRRGGPVVFDETLHGFEDQPSLWKALFRFPLVLVTLHLLICAVLLLWAAVGRFGPARPAPPPLPSGKDFLIRNTAALLHFGGHDAPALRRYLGTSIHHVRNDLHAPRDLDPAALRTWLERVRVDRGGKISLPDLEREVWEVTNLAREHPKRIIDLAARIHRWRTEMTHGPRNAT